MSNIDPFILDFDLLHGICQSGKVAPIKRYVADMATQFADAEAARQLSENKNPLLYEFYNLDLPQEPGALQFGTSILQPGKVGNEYFMTKGHFHTILDTAEIYYCLSGQGMMVMETPEGKVDIQELKPGTALNVPGRWAHRSVNTGSEPLVTFFVFRADAGHDYGSIEEKGFRKLVVEIDGKPAVIENPKWMQK